MKKNYQSNLILIFLLTILTLYLVNADLIVTNIIDYTILFFTKLFPTSFLIYTFSSLLLNYRLVDVLSKITKSGPTSYVTALSLISGFPSGPKYTADLYNKGYLNEEQANSLLTYTHFPNPLFILGPISTLLGSKSQALKILIIILISNFLVFLIFKTTSKSERVPVTTPKSFSKILGESITNAIKMQILIYGTSLFFYLIALQIIYYLKPSPLYYTLINGIFDLTKGIFATSSISNITTQCLFIIFFLSFGSISIHLQIKSILANTSLNYNNFLIGRTISTLLAITIFLLTLAF